VLLREEFIPYISQGKGICTRQGPLGSSSLVRRQKLAGREAWARAFSGVSFRKISNTNSLGTAPLNNSGSGLSGGLPLSGAR
jgi:hypothetical protein